MVFKGIPDFICHFHFLRDIGKDLFEKQYAIIRRRLKAHKIRPLLRQKAKALGKIIEDDPQTFGSLAVGIDNGCVGSTDMEKLSTMAAYAMVHWTFDTSELQGYGFPFDCPHLIFYQRLKKLHDLINEQRLKNKTLSGLWRPLTKVVEDPQLKNAASQMQKKVVTLKNCGMPFP